LSSNLVYCWPNGVNASDCFVAKRFASYFARQPHFGHFDDCGASGAVAVVVADVVVIVGAVDERFVGVIVVSCDDVVEVAW
jgi:hypothetical protein